MAVSLSILIAKEEKDAVLGAILEPEPEGYCKSSTSRLGFGFSRTIPTVPVLETMEAVYKSGERDSPLLVPVLLTVNVDLRRLLVPDLEPAVGRLGVVVSVVSVEDRSCPVLENGGLSLSGPLLVLVDGEIGVMIVDGLTPDSMEPVELPSAAGEGFERPFLSLFALHSCKRPTYFLSVPPNILLALYVTARIPIDWKTTWYPVIAC
jgi:hypothetical protein